MSSLLARRPPGWRMHEEDGQGSLFGGEAFLPPRSRPAPSTGGRERRRQEIAAPPGGVAPWAPAGEVAPWAPPEEVAPWAPDDLDAGVDSAPADDLGSPPEAGVSAREVRVSRRPAAAPLAGPTLDDAVSRAWEALVAGVPAACPVCHAEIEPGLTGSVQGACGSCHVTLD